LFGRRGQRQHLSFTAEQAGGLLTLKVSDSTDRSANGSTGSEGIDQPLDILRLAQVLIG
jgi:hypothetical protein